MEITSVDLTYYCAIFLIWITSTLLLGPFIKTLVISISSPKLRPPPGPLGLPIIGHLHLLTSSSFPQSLQTLARRYGSLMQIRLAGNDVVVASNAKAAEAIMKTHDVEFASKYYLGFGLSKFNIYDGDGFINSQYGTYWRFMKKLCKTKLLAGAQIERFSHIREEMTLRMLKSLVSRSKKGESCNLIMEMSTLTNEIICKMVLGRRCEENPNLPDTIRKTIKRVMECGAKISFIQMFGPLNRFDIFGNGKRLTLAMQEFDGLIEKVFTDFELKHMTNSSREDKDVADILLETFVDSNAEVKLTKNKIKHFFLDIFTAGVDTTSATIQWAIQELLCHPNTLKKLRDEIKREVGSKRLVQESDIRNLPFLQSVVKETLRKHPPGSLIRRESMTNTEINGYDIKQGTKIIINAYAIMHDPETFREPDKFIPERFLVDHQDMDFYGTDFNFVPFGSGRRACIGASHGILVTTATVASLIQCFDFKLKDGEYFDIGVVNGYSGPIPLPLVCYPALRFDPFDV